MGGQFWSQLCLFIHFIRYFFKYLYKIIMFRLLILIALVATVSVRSHLFNSWMNSPWWFYSRGLRCTCIDTLFSRFGRITLIPPLISLSSSANNHHHGLLLHSRLSHPRLSPSRALPSTLEPLLMRRLLPDAAPRMLTRMAAALEVSEVRFSSESFYLYV